MQCYHSLSPLTITTHCYHSLLPLAVTTNQYGAAAFLQSRLRQRRCSLAGNMSPHGALVKTEFPKICEGVRDNTFLKWGSGQWAVGSGQWAVGNIWPHGALVKTEFPKICVGVRDNSIPGRQYLAPWGTCKNRISQICFDFIYEPVTNR